MHRKHKNTKIFLEETTREKTPQNFLSIELNQCSVKLRQQLLFYSALLLLSLTKNNLSESVQMKGGASYLYSSVDLTSNLVGSTSLAIRADLSN